MKITIPGRPYTKKNSQQIIKNPKTKRYQIVQSETYQNYEEACLWHLRPYKEKFDGPIQVTALYWMPNRQSWPDLLGLLQATCDILQKAGIIANDKFVISLDGSRIMGVDALNPRAEVTIEEMEGEK